MQNKSSLSTPPFSYILSPRHLQDSSIIFHQHILPNNYYFYYTDDMDFAYLAKDDTYVLIYGLCIDIQNNTLQNKEICSILSDSLLNGKERFYDAIDMLSGRFIIIYGYNKEYFILSDACGMLKITYDYENKAISNNIFLLDDYFRNKKREYRDNFNTKSFHQGCLGNLQPLKGMKILTPNHELDLKSFSINRFYPRKPIAPSSDTETISNRICHYIQIQEKLLNSQYHLLYSLTAEMDSRFTISSINRDTLADNSYFVYAVDDAHMNDLHIACCLADKLNIDLYCLINSKYKDTYCIKHHVLENVQDTKFINNITPWLWYNSGRRLLPYYIELLKKIQKNTLFIRSNLYEIGRAYWKNECHDINMILKLSKKEEQYTKKDQEIFVEYFKETGLTPEGICNQNLLDFFYWEHRMGTWICEVLQETDFVFNTHCYCNCRKILELFLSVDYESRKNATVFWNVIKNNEVISDIPINPRNYKLPATQVKQEKNTYPRKELSFRQLETEAFSPTTPTIYAIEWDGITYELLIRRQVESRQVVVWGNGDVDKKKHSLPIFQRHSWGKDLTFNGIWYFDPTLYRGEASLCWCYGTNVRWSLRDIAYLVYLILKKWNISLQQVLYFGSSAGGFTSMMLAILLHGKALAINPQFDCINFWPTKVKLFKKQVLCPGEEVLFERVNVTELIRKEHYCPSIHIVQNLLAENDMKKQLPLFLQQLPLCDEDTPVQIDFYKDIKGHAGLPAKERCLELIQREMPACEEAIDILLPEWIREMEKVLQDSKMQSGSEQLDLCCSLPVPPMQFTDSSILQLAHDLMYNKLVVVPQIEAVPYDLEKFDWGIETSKSPRTFQLYLQALNPVSLLARAYEKTNDITFINFAWRMITLWYNYATSEQAKKNFFVWGDHATALRAENLLYLAVQCEYNGLWKEEFYQFLCNILILHGEWIFNDIHYTKNHNHGIMQDQALLHLGYVFRKQEWIDHALERLEAQKANAFNEEWIPTENSPGYAFLVPSLFKKIGDFLIANKNEKGKELIACAELVKKFQGWIIKPNGILAQKGDTANIPAKCYGKPKRVSQDSATSVWWPHAGYYFYRSRKDTEIIHDTWKMFTAGFCNTTHKHADDCSFMLYSKGHEIFADGGAYGYIKDQFRVYFKSALAHNLVIVDEKSYPCTKENFRKTGMYGGVTTDDYDHIRAFKDTYEGVHLERDFCSCDDVTIIYDTMASSTPHIYSQLFHLAEDIEIIKADFHEVLLKIADSGFVARLRQYGSDGTLHVLKGDVNKPSFGLISRRMGHVSSIFTLKFDVLAKNGSFVTLITIEDEKGIVRLTHGNVHTEDIHWLENQKSFQLQENMVIPCRNALPPLLPRKHTDLDVLAHRVEKEDASCLVYRFIVEQPLPDAKYAWYIYKQGQNTAEIKIPYSSNTTHTHRFEIRGTYRVKLFVKTSKWKKTSFSNWFTVD